MANMAALNEPELEIIYYEWKISNFICHLLGADTSYSLASKPFGTSSSRDLIWQIELFPVGNGEAPKENISVNLYLALSKRPNIKAKCGFYIKNDEDNLVHEVTMKEFKPIGLKKMWSVPSLISHTTLYENKSALLPNDTLTIVCEIFVLSEVETVSHNKLLELEKAQVNSTEACIEAFDNLLKSAEFSDVTLKCGGKEFKAHKSILAARSAVFHAMFKSSLKENVLNLVEITDMDSTVFEQLLKYIYSGKLAKPSEILRSLFIAAEKYSIEPLKLELEFRMIQNLTIENALETLNFAEKFNAERLKTQALDFIKVNNIVSLVETEGWNDFLKTCSQLDLNIDNHADE